jgi:hypothetical protein
MQWLIAFISGIFIGQEVTNLPRIKIVFQNIKAFLEKPKESNEAKEPKEWILYEYIKKWW